MKILHEDVSEGDECRVAVIPADDGGALIEIDMSDDLAEEILAAAEDAGLTPEEFIRHLMNIGCDGDDLGV